MTDAQVPNEDSCELDDDAGTSHSDSFIVPAEGGHFEFCSTTGLVRLDFPSTLAGMHITLTALDPQTFAWPHPGFASAMSDVIRVETDTTISQPVRIRLPHGLLLGLVFYAESTVPLPLRLSDDRTSLELEHAGVLGVLAPTRSCESTLGAAFTNAWIEEPHSGICSGFGPRSTWRHYECANAPFCQEYRSWCCVYPGDTRSACTIDHGIHYNDFFRAGPNASYPYCDGVSDSPYIGGVSPSDLIANYMDQEVTLTGNHFQPGGYAAAGDVKGSTSNQYILQSTWISSTEVRVIVSAQALPPLLWYVYINPGYDGQLQSIRYSNWFAGNVRPPAVSCPVPLQGSPPHGACGSLPTGCQCSVDFNPGDGTHTYAMSCTDGSCTCARDGVSIATKPRINACNSDASTQDQWRRSCLSAPGFCP